MNLAVGDVLPYLGAVAIWVAVVAWERRRQGARPSHELQMQKAAARLLKLRKSDPETADKLTGDAAAAYRAGEESYQADLLARAPGDKKAARELRRRLKGELKTLERMRADLNKKGKIDDAMKRISKDID